MPSAAWLQAELQGQRDKVRCDMYHAPLYRLTTCDTACQLVPRTTGVSSYRSSGIVIAGANAQLSEFNSKDLRNVGNYAVGRLIGKGSFGKVYLASHKLINGSKVRSTFTKSSGASDIDNCAGGAQVSKQR